MGTVSRLAITLEPLPLPEKLRYLAGWLTKGKDPGAVTLALEMIAGEAAEGGWGATRDRITESNEARRDERERCAQLAEQEAASADLQVASDEARIAATVLRTFAKRLREQP